MRRSARCLAALALAALGVSCAALVDLQEVPYAERPAAPDGAAAADASPAATPDAADAADAALPDDGAACAVRPDGKLRCTNRQDAPLHALPQESSAVVNTLRTTTSYFLCWGAGERHAGGNTTWYYTIGDDNPNLGWTPGVMLNTPDMFDVNPSAFGLRNCSE
jgi:hypothetical protein